MRIIPGRIVVVLVAALASSFGLSASTRALADFPSGMFAPCGESNEFACGHLTVPLDPSGTAPGTLTLALRRHRASVGDARTAIIALAGGPGQPALPFASEFAELLGPIAATRDLIVFDQRGIGLSDPLACHAFEHPSSYGAFGELIEACASQLGPARAFYTTADTVADIEAIRRAGGYEKLVLYGTSYGTKVAELYAQTYPSHVEALILDSVVPANGPEPLERPTFEAVPRILRQMCAAGACAHVTDHPVDDLAHVLAGMRRAPLHGRAIDEHGKAHEVSISAADLAEILLAGDFFPALRAELVTALAAAAHGDTAPLARMLVTAARAEGGEGEDFDTPLYYATTCEEQDFPWSRTADPAARLAQASAAARALPASAFAPFGAATALAVGDLEGCAHWPFTSPAPALDTAPLPDVPTLILSGTGDLRTPSANAREVAAQIPDAQLLVVPYTGHAVLEDEPTQCAREALRALFATSTVEPCRPAPPPPSLKPPPLPPLRVGLVVPEHGYHGLTGRTLRAVRLTLADSIRQLALRLDTLQSATASTVVRIGGLRGGWMELSAGGLSFDGYSYVPGLTLTGTIKTERADLQVEGRGAAHGTLRLAAHRALVGELSGQRVTLAADPAAIVAVDAQASPHSRAGGAGARADARELAELLGGIGP